VGHLLQGGAGSAHTSTPAKSRGAHLCIVEFAQNFFSTQIRAGI
jgi:hypothetical protein